MINLEVYQTSCCEAKENNKLPVAIIGSGPVGLAAAAHLIARGESFVLFEAGEKVGANIMKWAHVHLFSPWQYNIDKAARKLLLSSGWVAPDDSAIPSGKELVESYLMPLAQLSEIKPFIHLQTQVVAISRKGLSKVKTQGREQLPFAIHVKKMINGLSLRPERSLMHQGLGLIRIQSIQKAFLRQKRSLLIVKFIMEYLSLWLEVVTPQSIHFWN